MRATSIGHAGIFVETRQGSILCDPWFNPAFFGSWFVFPRNDQLPPALVERIRHPSYLYISHLHGDHLDEEWLTANIPRHTPIILPGYPTHELRNRLESFGFSEFIQTVDGEEMDLGDGLTVAIHVETSITDGPAGDSAIVISDGVHRLVDQNDCRTHDLGALGSHGPVDLHWLQFSGAIWYPMVYDEPVETLRELAKSKVDSQFARALRYVEALDAAYVVPSAGPPCFLDPDLFQFNVIDGDEASIFPDQREFISRLEAIGRRGIMNVPGTSMQLSIGADGSTHVDFEHPFDDDTVRSIFSNKRAYLEAYQTDYLPWLDDMKDRWAEPTADLLQTVKFWWEPLLAMAPTLRQGVGAACLLRAGDLDILIDFPNGRIRAYAGEEYGFRFEIDRRLVETVVAQRAVDWSDKLFLSCRFRAWRRGPYNEYLYNFFKSLSVERMQRTEEEAREKIAPPPPSEEIELGGYVVERYCPHRQADLSVFGHVDGNVLTCTLHGWTFDLDSGRCLTAEDRKLRVRRAGEPKD
jgi:UDP-MurNAc hydroxylase